MPELPEVQHVVASLQDLVGDSLTGVIEGTHQPPSADLLRSVAMLAPARVEAVGRRGKWIVIDLAGGASLLIHLRLTGSLLFGVPQDHVRWTLVFEHRELTLVDPRAFGTLQVVPSDRLETFFKSRLGKEPVDGSFDGAYLAQKLARRGGAVKSALLDQKVAAGAGNIYVDEALWAARVHPLRAANSLDADEYERLARALVKAICLGIERGGSSVRNYLHADGSAGTNQNHLAAYGRAGKPCLRCGRPLSYGKVSGRGTVWCESCQSQNPA
jgi:formamidopyrimidine-DNA glycosylase